MRSAQRPAGACFLVGLRIAGAIAMPAKAKTKQAVKKAEMDVEKAGKQIEAEAKKAGHDLKTGAKKLRGKI